MAAKRGRSDELGLALTFLRRLRGWTQKQLAAAAGISFAGLRALEQGRRRWPRQGTLSRITDALGMDLTAAAELVAVIRGQRGGTLSTLAGCETADVIVVAGGFFPSSVTAVLLAATGASDGPDGASRGFEVDGWKASDLGRREELALTVTLLRWCKGWTQKTLAEASGLTLTGMQSIEQEGGRWPPPAALVSALATDLAALTRVMVVVRRLRHLLNAAPASARPPGGATAREAPLPDLRRELTALLRAEAHAAVSATAVGGREETRLRLRSLWPLLAACSHAALKGLVNSLRELQSLEACELFCQQSLDAAGDSANRAERLAELAVLAAERVAGSDALRSRLRGFAGVHLASALRVAGKDLPAASKLLDSALDAWNLGARADGGFLNAARVCGLQASMRRDQRRLAEAVAALDEGLAIDRWGETPTLRLAKARTLIELQEFEASIDQLRFVGYSIDKDSGPRRPYVVESLWVFNLCQLGRYDAAEMRLPELRELARGNRLDLLRADWQIGTVATGLGRHEEALTVLRQVRAEFIALRNAYDAALVTLELAEVHAALGNTIEVKVLVRESAPIFVSQQVHREARRALELFRLAAEEERVTCELLRPLIAYLHRARRDPQLRFAMGA